MVWLRQPAPIKIGVPRGRCLSTFARRTYLRLLDDRSYQLPQSANSASRTQPRPRGTLIADQRRACAARPKGKKAEARGRSLLQTGRFKFFPATGSQAPMSPPSFIQSTFTSHTGSLVLSLYAPRYCLTASAGFGRQFTKLRALSRLRRRYGSKKESSPSSPRSPSSPVTQSCPWPRPGGR